MGVENEQFVSAMCGIAAAIMFFLPIIFAYK